MHREIMRELGDKGIFNYQGRISDAEWKIARLRKL
jgi:predicted transcriptional regulator YheO